MATETFYNLRGEKQEAVMRSAIHEFVMHGFTRAKVSDIARGACVAKGSMYQYFEDKEKLFVYCAKWSLDVFMKKLDVRMDIGSKDVFEYLEDSSGVHDILQEEHELAKFMLVALNEPGLLDKATKAMYDIGNVYMKKLIQNGVVMGVVRKDIDIDLLVTYLSAMTDRFNHRWLRLYVDIDSEVDIEMAQAKENEKKQMIELLKKGMGC